MSRGGKKGGRNHKFFEELAPMQRALNVIYDDRPDRKKVKRDGAEERERHEAKLARRAAAAKKGQR